MAWPTEKYEGLAPSLWASSWQRLFISWTFENIAYLYCIYCGCPLPPLAALIFISVSAAPSLFPSVFFFVALPSAKTLKLQLCAHYFTCGVRNSSCSSDETADGNAHMHRRERKQDTVTVGVTQTPMHIHGCTQTHAGGQLGMTQFCRTVFPWHFYFSVYTS